MVANEVEASVPRGVGRTHKRRPEVDTMPWLRRTSVPIRRGDLRSTATTSKDRKLPLRVVRLTGKNFMLK